ncbi:MAG: amino acid ABC transporter permease [Deltaproteobacteria bacterium]|nr:amino acid ABC transporter permease [Deltaproteobacteria bacterium]
MAEDLSAGNDASASEAVPFWHDPAKRGMAFQAAFLILVLTMGYVLFTITRGNLERQSIATGFDFLTREAGFEIGESLIAYSAANTYARALVVGILNTLKVAVIGIVMTVVLGGLVGVARLSANWLLARLAAAYIEVLQNIPILLQLFFWYAIFREVLPSPRQTMNPIAGVYFNNRGFFFPVPKHDPAHEMMAAAFVAAWVAGLFLRRWARRRQDLTGRTFPGWTCSVLLLLLFPFGVWLAFGAPSAMEIPQLKGFNFEGGLSISPEFGALLLGLVLYTSAFVAEIVRAGIQAVSHGQTEAAMSIGLRPSLVLSLIVLPQALRVIIPPLTSQMLNLTKNSSLAVAIGYPDVVSVVNTTINQTGQAIEGVLMIMTVYLVLSLATSAFMNWYNKKMALVER